MSPVWRITYHGCPNNPRYRRDKDRAVTVTGTKAYAMEYAAELERFQGVKVVSIRQVGTEKATEERSNRDALASVGINSCIGSDPSPALLPSIVARAETELASWGMSGDHTLAIDSPPMQRLPVQPHSVEAESHLLSPLQAARPQTHNVPDDREARCAKCGQRFASRKLAVPHLVRCQKNWTPSLDEVVAEKPQTHVQTKEA